MRIRNLFLSSLFLVLPVISWADTHVAATCSAASIQTAVNASTDGDTISIPAGTCTWSASDTVTINKSLYVKGAGTTSGSNLTKIIHQTASGGAITFNVTLSSDVTLDFSGIYIDKVNTGGNSGTSIRALKITNGQGVNGNLTKVRVHHNTFNMGSYTVHVSGRFSGVIDNNKFVNCDTGIYVAGDNDSAWERDIAAGTANATFIEDNTFVFDSNNDRTGDHTNQQVYCTEGAIPVVRNNTFDGSAYTAGYFFMFNTHGNSPGVAYSSSSYPNNTRGAPISEVYNNTFTAYNCYGYTSDMRGGSILFYGNSFTCKSGAGAIQLWEEEAQTGYRTVWPAYDQIANSFFWDNTVNGSTITDITLNVPALEGTFIQKDRDYFMHAPQSSGGKTSYSYRTDHNATGKGASQSNPTASDTGTSKFSASGANAYYPYTAYTYPHPLRKLAAPVLKVVQN